jgi:hypothetical protein
VGLFEISAMERARKYEVGTFNKFREALGLPGKFFSSFKALSRIVDTQLFLAYKSFEEWCDNAEVARTAQGLYQTIDNLELYVSDFHQPGIK